jgi:lysozyme family protein
MQQWERSMAEARFELCLAHVLRHEGGYVDHPADPGGATNMGITLKTLARWRQVTPWWDLPKAEVKALSHGEAGRIYRALYWNACRAGELPPGMDLVVFDYAVNSGADRATRTLQAALGVVVDGRVGPLTIAAAREADAARIINAICDRRLGFLRALKTFPTFGRGWTSRVAAVRAAALAVAPATQSPSQGDRHMDILSGYKTYIVAAFMLIAGLAQIAGVDLPALESGSAGSLVLEALAILFLRKGLKGDIGRA